MNNIKFSLITVTYNSEKYIRDTIESVLAQTYTNYEYIVIDGESSDRTMEIVREYEGRFEGKLRYISEKDKGIYDAMNKGIDMATGDLIGIINSDDWYEKDALENIYFIHKGEVNVIYYGYMRTVDSDSGREIRCARYSHEFIKEAMINHPTVFVSKEIYDKYGKYDCQYRASADYEFVVRLSNEPDIRFVPIDKVQANFRTGGVSEDTTALMETMKIKYRYKQISLLQYIASVIFLKGKRLFKYS